METKIPTIEKILTETLELHEKGVSLHSIVRTYPEHKAEIEELFGSMATLSLEKEKIVVPKGGLERLLAKLPETAAIDPKKARVSVKSPFSTFMSSIQLSTLKFVLPIAALALLTGGIVLHNKTSVVEPIAMNVPSTVTTPGASAPAATPTTDTTRKNVTAPNAGTTAPAATGTAPTPMTMAMNAPATPTDRMVAAFNVEAAKETTIAQENDAESAQAISSQQSMQTDPTK